MRINLNKILSIILSIVIIFILYNIVIYYITDIKYSNITYVGEPEEIKIANNYGLLKYSFSIEDESIAELSQDNKKIVPISTGQTKLIISGKLGNKELFSETKEITICPNISEGLTSGNYINLSKGETYQIILDNTDSCFKDVSFSSLDDKIAKVDKSGKVTAVENGSTAIKMATNNKEFSIVVDVINNQEIIPVNDLQIDKESVTMYIGDKIIINTVVSPSDATNKRVLWSSSDITVAKVDETGNITGVSNGIAIITATTYDGNHQKQITVTVNKANSVNASGSGAVNIIVPKTKKTIYATSISLNKSSSSISIGSQITLIASITPSNVTDTTATWTSSDKSIATVDTNGTVKGIKAGTTTITAKTSNGKTAKCSVTVKSIEATGISLSLGSTGLSVGSTVNLVGTITPINATDKTLTWTSSDKSIATVDANGTVKGIKAGTTTITAKTSNGKTAKCTVTVTAVSKTIAVTGITLNKSSSSISAGSQVSLLATVSPSNATDKTLTWTSSDKSIATVDANGTVKGIKSGTTTITARTSNGKTAKCTVTVTAVSQATAVTSVSLDKTSQTIYLNGTKTVQLTATVSPSNATNKTVTWTSSNKNVATVSSTGKVSGVGPGEATITVTTSNGKTAKITITVKKKVIIEVGASQSGRFVKYNVFSYTKGSNTYTYNESSPYTGTLVHIYLGGAKMPWQYETNQDGYKNTKSTIEAYSGQKKYIEFYLYYLLIGNTICQYTCSTIQSDTSTYKTHLTGYSNAAKYFTNAGYDVKTYVVSMHPVKPGESADDDNTVSNTNSKYCDAKIRSNWKYNLYNNKVKSEISKNYSNLIYVDTFNKIMDTSSATEASRKYSYKVTYTTDDGIHWDSATSSKYLTWMLESNGNL